VVIRGVDGIGGVDPLPDVGNHFWCRTVDKVTKQWFCKPPELLLFVRIFSLFSLRIRRGDTLQVVFVPPCGILKLCSYLLMFPVR